MQRLEDGNTEVVHASPAHHSWTVAARDSHTRRCTGGWVGLTVETGVCVFRGGVKGLSTNTELLTVSFGSGGVWRGLWAYCMKLTNRGGWRRPLDAIYGRDSAREDNTRGRYCVL